jgi:hypothetical protein
MISMYWPAVTVSKNVRLKTVAPPSAAFGILTTVAELAMFVPFFLNQTVAV